MDRKSERKIFFFLLSSILVLWAGNEVFPSNPHMNFDIQSHSLKIQLDPLTHVIKAEDQMEISFKEGKAQTLSLLLHSKLRITHIVNLKTKKPLSWKEIPDSDIVKRLDVSLKKEEGPPFLSISYEGPIHDPVAKEKALQFVRGDETSGLIGSEGVYLSSSSYWFPDKPGSMAIFNLEASIPEPFRVVTQGELLSEELKEGFWRSKWRNEWPTESLALVAGKYSVKSRKVNGVKISTYFFQQDDGFSEIFLDRAEEYLKIYPEFLGPFPYRKFDIVQNFFSSGYSFPTFTLLAPEAIRQGKEFLRPGALDHEIVHSWWGHHVSGKPGTGNWLEALTTYCTNYFYKELKIGEEAARKHRQDVVQKYAIQVPPTKDYPLRQFEGKEGEIDGQIGYGKGSMVFHMLRQMVGKDLFFTTLKNFSKKYGGRQATWGDFKTAFEETGGKKLDRFFSQWLDRPGGPQLKLESVKYKVTPKGYLISGEVVQEGEIYEVQAKGKVEMNEGGKDLLIDISKRKNSFSIEVPNIPISLILDPDHHIFRRLYPEEIIPCFNAFLEDSEAFSPPPSLRGVYSETPQGKPSPKKIFVVPDEGKGEAETRKIYIELAKMARERKGGEILSEREVTEEKILNSSLMLLGESWKNPLFSKLISKLPSPVILKEENFVVDGEKVDDGEESLLLTYPHPLRPEKWVTIYFGQSAEGLSRARYIFFYGWDSYVLFKKGRPDKRGEFRSLRSFISHDFTTTDHLSKIQPLESKGETTR
jgi:aminopeptidase N